MPVFCCSTSICWSSSPAMRSKSAIIISICATWRRFSSTWNFLSRIRLSLRDFMTCTPYPIKSLRCRVNPCPAPSVGRLRLVNDRLEQLVAVGNRHALFPLLAQERLQRRVDRDGAVNLGIRSFPVSPQSDQLLHVGEHRQ